MTEWKESDVCELLGLSRSEFKQFRLDATEGLHWRKKPGNGLSFMWPIMWNEEGIKFLKEKAGIVDEVLAELDDKKAKESSTYAVVIGRTKNPRMLLCSIHCGNDTKQEYVLCRDNANFVSGMKVPIRSDGKRWVAAKHPRFGGRW
jgi:hypothetical protein